MKYTSDLLVKTIIAHFYDTQDGTPEPIVCALLEIADTADGHNCLACNLANSVEQLSEIALAFESIKSPETAITTYILFLYLLVERMHVAATLIGIDADFSNIFPISAHTRRWANFLKHPKDFFFTHHPEFDPEDLDEKTVIDSGFIDKYYAGSKHNQALRESLRNSSSIAVVLPNLYTLTSGVGSELTALYQLIKSNPHYQQRLIGTVILDNYFEAGDA